MKIRTLSRGLKVMIQNILRLKLKKNSPQLIIHVEVIEITEQQCSHFASPHIQYYKKTYSIQKFTILLYSEY